MNYLFVSSFNRFLFPLVTLCVLCFAAISLATIPAAHVINLSGTVTNKGERLRPGDPLFEGAEIITAENAKAKLLLRDKTLIDLSPSTRFKISKLEMNPGTSRNIELQLDEGKARASIREKLKKRSKFHLRTKSSVLAVRGTELVADLTKTAGGTVQEKITVLSGEVLAQPVVGGGEPIVIAPGKQLQLVAPETKQNTPNASSPNQGPKAQVKIRDMEVKDLEQIKTETTVANNTFSQSIKFDESADGGDGNAGLKTLATVGKAIPKDFRRLASKEREKDKETPNEDKKDPKKDAKPNKDRGPDSETKAEEGGKPQAPGEKKAPAFDKKSDGEKELPAFDQGGDGAIIDALPNQKGPGAIGPKHDDISQNGDQEAGGNQFDIIRIKVKYNP